MKKRSSCISLVAKDYRTMTSRWRGAPYCRGHGRELFSKQPRFCSRNIGGATVERLRGRRRIRRVGRLVVDWGSVSSRGLGRSMDGGEGAARYESVYVRKRRSSSAARARVQKGTYCFHYYVVSQTRGLARFLVGYLGRYIGGNVR